MLLATISRVANNLGKRFAKPIMGVFTLEESKSTSRGS
jgi:hypothetical protein